MGSYPEEYEVVVVGGGFGGTFALKHLRDLGFHVHVFEAGAALGGIWYWNCYPGCRVDVPQPAYQHLAPEIAKGWSWTEAYASRDEMVEYFKHVDNVWDLSKDVTFNARVQKAHWNSNTKRWDLTVSRKTEQGTIDFKVHSRFTIFCTGFASKHYIPPFPALDNFQGIVRHSALWSEDIELEGKRVAVIGTGASGVQFVQTVAPIAKQLTLYQRTPNMALPMGNKPLTESDNKAYQERVLEDYQKMRSTYAGFLYEFDPRTTATVTEEDREAFFEKLYREGGGNYWLGNFSDILFDRKANALAYDFWRKKTLERVHDPEMQRHLAPEKPVHPFGTKRVSLEKDYFEQFNRENVDLVDMNAYPIEFTEKGIWTSKGEKEFDVVCMATGFDSVTGGLTQIDLRGENGTLIKDKWSNGVRSHLGMTTSGFPNMFYIYGPQAPTAFATGPACAEAQSKWIGDVLIHMREHNISTMEPTPEAEAGWKEHVDTVAAMGLFHEAKSWYFGDNIPGKARESLNYMAGMPTYRKMCAQTSENGYKDFVMA